MISLSLVSAVSSFLVFSCLFLSFLVFSFLVLAVLFYYVSHLALLVFKFRLFTSFSSLEKVFLFS